MMRVRTDIALLDEILAPARAAIGAAYPGYRNHCYRVFNFCDAYAGGAGEPDKIAIAAAFHDLGIWTDGTFDYLAPSRRLARRHLAAAGRDGWSDEVEAMIDNHHKIGAWRGQPDWLVEPFRKADWADVSLGLLRWELPRPFMAEVFAALPNAGFHRTLLGLTLRRMRRHPFSPLPMMKL